jgi:hypothetical protein
MVGVVILEMPPAGDGLGDVVQKMIVIQWEITPSQICRTRQRDMHNGARPFKTVENRFCETKWVGTKGFTVATCVAARKKSATP